MSVGCLDCDLSNSIVFVIVEFMSIYICHGSSGEVQEKKTKTKKEIKSEKPETTSLALS